VTKSRSLCWNVLCTFHVSAICEPLFLYVMLVWQFGKNYYNCLNIYCSSEGLGLELIRIMHSLKVATHVTASFTSSHDQSFHTSKHKIPSTPHSTSTLEHLDDNVLALAAFVFMCKRKLQKKKRDVWCKNWLMKRKIYSHINLLSELKIYLRDWHNCQNEWRNLFEPFITRNTFN
jgi:hypothetical protein